MINGKLTELKAEVNLTTFVVVFVLGDTEFYFTRRNISYFPNSTFCYVKERVLQDTI